ncbi:MAG: alpha-D-glucose phosphate-specific phosphoglucomutase [Deltaproteobacteria bacterium]|nr:alpha-D-glucose phosphate-specific phosphoglucomutase [Deltaproteobacteria bacterium]
MPHRLAGTKAPLESLVDVPALVSAYYTEAPDAGDPAQRVAFGTSGHRGGAFRRSFNDPHIAAVAQAVAEVRRAQNVTGPLCLVKDTHALSEPALRTALEVLIANGVDVLISDPSVPTPTPVASHAIRAYNRGRTRGFADGLIVTPSHNPPDDGGIKYNPPHGGPADSAATSVIEKRANELLGEPSAIKRAAFSEARKHAKQVDFVAGYVRELVSVLDLECVRSAGVRVGADPMGGSAVAVLERIADEYRLDLDVVSSEVDPRFAFVPLDHDGKIRMDCSSPHAMARLVALSHRYDVAFGNDADADRHGIVTRSSGLMNPNHFLAVAIHHLIGTRSSWSKDTLIGKTLVSSSLIDRVASDLGRRVSEVPVGFKWFVSGLEDGTYGFGGEESAGASFLRFDGTAWTTDKDGVLLGLLAAEISGRTGRDPGEHYERLAERLGRPTYARIDAAATPAEKSALSKLSPDQVTATQLAGEPIVSKLTRAPGNGAAMGGLKVTTENGWFAARPSGTEDVYKIYAESFRGHDHLAAIQEEAKAIVQKTLGAARE